MEFKTLDEVQLEKIHEAFVDAFFDYQVKMDLPFSKFHHMMNRRGFSPELSLGAFSDGKLVGFVLNGHRIYEGKKTVYDMGTGVVKSHRRQGITTRILKELEPVLKNSGMEQYLLEVLQENTSAYDLYLKQGFQVTRSFLCYRIPKDKATCQKTQEVQRLSLENLEEMKVFWDFIPSWQNSIASIEAVKETFCFSVVMEEEKVVGYGLIDKLTGDIPQLAVNKSHRGQGIGGSILQDLLLQTEAPQGILLNVEEGAGSMDQFLKACGAENTVNQFEMVKMI